MYNQAKYLIAGDSALVIEFGDQISPEISAKVRGMYLAIEQSGVEGIVALNPTYRSLMVQYNPRIKRYGDLLAELQQLERNLGQMNLPQPNVFEVPTLYGGEHGPDLPTVCDNAKLSPEQVIKIHSGPEYLIYMLGFTPGFPYLGGMDEAIATPRLKTPRTKIPGGSVGIAGSQTGIYSVDSPGGWQLIGHTPVPLYKPDRTPPIFYKTGDYIKFVPIDQNEYNRILAAVQNGTYQYRLYPKKEGGI